MTQTEEKILDKIKKLLALADTQNNSTPDEAATAAAKVQELLQKYNLDQSLLHTNSTKHRMRVAEIALPTTRLWVKNLLATLARYNFCHALWSTHTAYLVGDETNIEVVLALYDHLGNALKNMATVYYTQYVANRKSLRLRPVAVQTYKANFYEGAINSIMYRLAKQQKEFAASSNTSKALIISNVEELKAFEAERFPGVRQVDTMKRNDVNAHGFKAGIQAGLKVELNKLVKEG